MPVPAAELDKSKTLESMSRPFEKEWRHDFCKRCRTNPHPRGFNHNTQLCWYCSFSGVGGVR